MASNETQTKGETMTTTTTNHFVKLTVKTVDCGGLLLSFFDNGVTDFEGWKLVASLHDAELNSWGSIWQNRKSGQFRWLSADCMVSLTGFNSPQKAATAGYKYEAE